MVNSALPPNRTDLGTYDSAIGYRASSPAELTPEQWARTIWEQAPTPLRWFVITGWRAALLLRLGPLDARDHVLGWTITKNDDDEVVVRAESRLIEAHNTFATDDSGVRWSTYVRYRNRLAPVVWAPVSVLHRGLARLFLGNAIKRVHPMV